MLNPSIMPYMGFIAPPPRKPIRVRLEPEEVIEGV